jgi:hypothetical protein
VEGGSETQKIADVKRVAEVFLKNTLGETPYFVGIVKEEKGWIIQAEIIEDSEYTRKRARDDIIALYEVILNENLEILSYFRKDFRERGKIGKSYI